ncbi:MAG: amidohydrolase family protein [Acidobacteria bacterium]|nr:amidohydrolase family protein [Acidobacteriota bacterium]
MKESAIVSLVFLVAILSNAKAQQETLPPEVIAYPDMVLYHGKILTADDSFTVVEAIAVRDGKFLAVGRSDYIRRMVGPRTQQIDLNGRTVVPGFIDTHLHQAFIGQISKAGSRLGLEDLGSALEEIKKAVVKAAPGEWLFFYAPDNNVLFNEINRKLLDSVAPNNPLAIVSLCNVGMAVPEDQIAQLPIDLTVVGGKIVYDRSKDGIIRLLYWDAEERDSESRQRM